MVAYHLFIVTFILCVQSFKAMNNKQHIDSPSLSKDKFPTGIDKCYFTVWQ